MIVALYARVSTADQDEQLQLPRMRDYCGRKDYHIYKEYLDEASGKNKNRPGWLALESDARAGCFEAVIVTKLDRMMRSLVDFLETLNQFSARGIKIITLDQDVIDPSSANSRLQIQMLAMLAEWERSIISERTREALHELKRKGTKLGKPAAKIPLHKVALLRIAGATWEQCSIETGIPATTLRNHKREINDEIEKIQRSSV